LYWIVLPYLSGLPERHSITVSILMDNYNKDFVRIYMAVMCGKVRPSRSIEFKSSAPRFRTKMLHSITLPLDSSRGWECWDRQSETRPCYRQTQLFQPPQCSWDIEV